MRRHAVELHSLEIFFFFLLDIRYVRPRDLQNEKNVRYGQTKNYYL